jgi:hypothetical protein
VLVPIKLAPFDTTICSCAVARDAENRTRGSQRKNRVYRRLIDGVANFPVTETLRRAYASLNQEASCVVGLSRSL